LIEKGGVRARSTKGTKAMNGINFFILSF